MDLVDMASAAAGFRWVVDGDEYDLTAFLDKHPGGPDTLLWCKGRDITTVVNTVHKDPYRIVFPVLRKYLVDRKDDSIKNKLGIPHFLLPRDFNAAEDIPEYDWDPKNEKLLLNTARSLILEKGVQQRIGELDSLFDVITACLCIAYTCLVYIWLSGYVPWWQAIPAFTILRTSIAGGGHYFLHRKKPYCFDALFDINYVGMAFTAQDGHVLIHHAYTQSDADVKRGFFGGMMGAPRLFRMLAHTLHKLGHVTTGMLIRGVELELEPDNDEHQGAPQYTRRRFRRSAHWSFWLMHTWLRIELSLAIYCGVGWVWLAQFCTALWFNTLMVVSSHDFTDCLEPDSKDWARFQLLNAHDMTLVGNRWIDAFLSAGLAPHRAHHVFPYQRSGFANIYASEILAAAAKKHGLPWLPAKNFFSEIFPMIFTMYLWSPVADPIMRTPYYDSIIAEHTDPACYMYTVKYILDGFKGIGSL